MTTLDHSSNYLVCEKSRQMIKLEKNITITYTFKRLEYVLKFAQGKVLIYRYSNRNLDLDKYDKIGEKNIICY